MYITAERLELYRRVPPPGGSSSIELGPFTIDDSIPSMDKIEWTVFCLWHYQSGGYVRYTVRTLAILADSGDT